MLQLSSLTRLSLKGLLVTSAHLACRKRAAYSLATVLRLPEHLNVPLMQFVSLEVLLSRIGSSLVSELSVITDINFYAK